MYMVSTCVQTGGRMFVKYIVSLQTAKIIYTPHDCNPCALIFLLVGSAFNLRKDSPPHIATLFLAKSDFRGVRLMCWRRLTSHNLGTAAKILKKENWRKNARHTCFRNSSLQPRAVAEKQQEFLTACGNAFWEQTSSTWRRHITQHGGAVKTISHSSCREFLWKTLTWNTTKCVYLDR